jgi:hypothetical protein
VCRARSALSTGAESDTGVTGTVIVATANLTLRVD